MWAWLFSFGMSLSWGQSPRGVNPKSPEIIPVFREALNSNPKTFVPFFAEQTNDVGLSHLLFHSLMGRDLDRYTDLPGICDRVQELDKGTRLRFHIDPLARWSDQTPITTEDVEFSFKTVHSPQAPSTVWKQLLAGVKFKKVDRLRFEFHLDSAQFAQKFHLRAFQPIQKKQFEKVTDFLKSKEVMNPVTSGPYIVDRFNPNEELVLKQRDQLWIRHHAQYRGIFPVKNWIYKIIPDSRLAYEHWRQGKLDFISLSPDLVPLVLKDKISDSRIVKASTPGVSWSGFVYQLQHPVLKSSHVRQAIAHCVPLDQMVENAYHGLASASVGPFSGGVSATAPSVRAGRYRWSIELARAELEKAGCTSEGLSWSCPGGKTEFTITVSSQSETAKSLALQAQESLKKCGIVIQIQLVDSAQYFERLHAKQFEMAFLLWSIGLAYHDPVQHWATESIQKGSNFGGYSNPDVDRILLDMTKAPDLESRQKLLGKLSQLIYRDQPYLFIADRTQLWFGINPPFRLSVPLRKYSLHPSLDSLTIVRDQLKKSP